MENLPVDYFITSHQFTKRTHRDVYPAIDPSSPSNSLAGKVILITGASGGLGADGFAPSFAAASPKALILIARSASALASVVARIQTLAPKIEVIGIPTDITDGRSVDALWADVKQRFGHADVLVNNAGTSNASSFIDADPLKWWGDYETNVRGFYLLARGFITLSSSHAATLISLTTAGALGVYPGMSSYSTSKIAALQLNAYIAAEHPNVTAIALHPGIVKTGMTNEAFERFAQDTPGLVGGTAVWLAAIGKEGEGEGRARFLNGRYVAANWDVGDLKAREREIVQGDLLTVKLTGRLGSDQFE